MGVFCIFCGQETAFLAASQVAQLLGVSHRAVTGWCKEGRFPGAVQLPHKGQGRGAWKIPSTAVVPIVQKRQAEKSGIPAS
jgi:predicted DNA-binding transcriptional regulator AlpA